MPGDLDFASMPYDIRASLNNVAVASCATLTGKKMQRKQAKANTQKHLRLLNRLRKFDEERWLNERDQRG